jgi:hypothetical protein
MFSNKCGRHCGGVCSKVSGGDTEVVYVQKYVGKTMRWFMISSKWGRHCGRICSAVSGGDPEVVYVQQ